MANIVPKFVNDPTNVVHPAVEAFCLLNKNVCLIENTHVVVLNKISPEKVGLICGGGSGHEPAHIGFVREGCLSAAVCGDVFASPPTSHVTAAINYIAEKQGDSKAGILVVVTQYTGDMINFGYAVREAKSRGVKVEMVVTADDASFGVAHDARRGIAGTVLTCKALGAAADACKPLEELVAMAKRFAENLRSMGASLSACAVPGEALGSVMPPNVVELGMGIHGEKGKNQVPYMNAKELVETLLNEILCGRQSVDSDKMEPWSACEVALLVNNLGSTTDIEMAIVTKEALEQLHEKGFKVTAVANGRYMTALEMHGISLSVMKVTNPEDVKFLLQPFPGENVMFFEPLEKVQLASGPLSALQLAKDEFRLDEKSLMRKVATKVFDELKSMEKKFNELDAAVGDGDMGSGVHRAAISVLEMIPYLPWTSNLKRAMNLIAKAVADSFGGTSGPVYGSFLVAAGDAGVAALHENKSTVLAEAMKAGAEAVSKIGNVVKGDRTSYDVMAAMVEHAELSAAGIDKYVKAAPDVAREAADAVKMLRAKKGRSRYSDGKEVGLPDPGAELMAFWVNSAARAYLKLENQQK